MALAPACLAHHEGALRAMTSGPIACDVADVSVSEAHTAIGATLWRAECRGRTYRCVANHAYDGPTHVRCAADSGDPTQSPHGSGG